MEVTFRLDEDGRHVWWGHKCLPEGVDLQPLPVTETPQHLLPILNDYWTVTQKEPLTVVPSIKCTICNCHGFITNGEWVPA